jgi:hypothetical protein
VTNYNKDIINFGEEEAYRMNAKPPSPKMHRYHYNLLAKIIRERFNDYTFTDLEYNPMFIGARGAILELALDLTKAFERDNPNFDPMRFLTACSPDNDLYPFTEMYEKEVNK